MMEPGIELTGVLGIVIIVLTTMSIFIGKNFGPSLIYEPKTKLYLKSIKIYKKEENSDIFWTLVVIYYTLGILCLICYFQSYW